LPIARVSKRTCYRTAKEISNSNNEAAATVENSIELVDLVDTTNTNLSNLQPEIPFAVSNCNVLQSVPIIAEE